jgi:hypothetical protein
MHDSELDPNTTETMDDKSVDTKVFVHKFFYSKKNESEEELRERFLERYSNIEDFEYVEADEYPNGAALVKKQKKGSSVEATNAYEGAVNPDMEVEVESSA